MPNYSTHLKIGTLTSVIISTFFFVFLWDTISIKIWHLVLVPFVIFFYSNVPDLDHHMGKLRKTVFTFIFMVMIAFSIIALFWNIWITALVFILTGMFGLFLYKIPHRGPLHSFWFIALAAFPLLFVHWFLALLGFIAAASHLIADRVFSSGKRKIKKALGIHSTYEINIRV